MKRESYKNRFVILAAVVFSLLPFLGTGCGSGSSDTSSSANSGVPVSGGSTSANSGVRMVSTPQGDAVQIPFTATAIAPAGTMTGSLSRRFLAGPLPFGSGPNGGSCGNYATSSADTINWCNQRNALLNVYNLFYGLRVYGSGIPFGSVVMSNMSNSQYIAQAQKAILGYEWDRMSSITMAMTQPVAVQCPGHFNVALTNETQVSQAQYTACAQTTITGVIVLSPYFIRENMPQGVSISNLAFDINLSGMGGLGFILSNRSGNSTVITF